jgi:DNA-binding winged helix-turn-helix (wHTH) protein
MSENRIRFYEFGPFRLDVSERQLWRDGDEITVTPKAFGVLITLVRNHGHTVEKDTFMQEVWAESVVEEKNLTDNISILRQVLIDDAKKPLYIKTVHTRGYRFVGDVAEVRDEEVEMLDEYDFSRGVVGKYAKQYTEGTNIVVLEPHVAKVFPDSAAVNQALRQLIEQRSR